MQDSNAAPLVKFSPLQRLAAWAVHLITASGAVWGLLSLWFIHEGNYIVAFWLMGLSIIIDAIDGTLARMANTKEAAPEVDGALLDNIVDYFTYVLVSAFFLLVADMLPWGWGFIGTSVLALASAYQFSQVDAKTDDHFFKGFPSYWNLVVFYLFFWQTSPWFNLIVILILSVLVFVPIKYIYPSRLEHLSSTAWVRWAFLAATLVWGVATAGMLIAYPSPAPVFTGICMAYALLYFGVSLYRTLVPVHVPESQPA